MNHYLIFGGLVFTQAVGGYTGIFGVVIVETKCNMDLFREKLKRI
jgi:hypothetical protein